MCQKRKRQQNVHMKGINRQRNQNTKDASQVAIHLHSPHQLSKPAAGRSTELRRKTIELSLLYRLFASHDYKSQGNLPITTLKIKLSRQDPSQQQHRQQLILANYISCSVDITLFTDRQI